MAPITKGNMADALTAEIPSAGGNTQMSEYRHLDEMETAVTESQASQSRRGIMIPGFPLPSSPLPHDIDHEMIIKHYPNHLRGKLLLQIAETWTPKEISATSGRPELKANTIVKRIRVARMVEARPTLQSTRKGKKPAKRATTPTAQEEPPPPPPALPTPPPSATSTTFSPLTPRFTESQASLNFLEEQTSIKNILEEMDPEWSDRQHGARKRRPHQDRMLVEMAVAEYERRRTEAAGSRARAGARQ